MTVLTIKEACTYLCVSRYTLYKLIDEKKVKGFRIGKRRLFTDEELDKFVRSQMVDDSDSVLVNKE